jgi:hypothetical protein
MADVFNAAESVFLLTQNEGDFSHLSDTEVHRSNSCLFYVIIHVLIADKIVLLRAT